MDEPKIEVHPVQTPRLRGERPVCPKAVTLAAYEVYSHVHGPQLALIEGNCRSGFGVGELIAFLYARSFPKEQWRHRVGRNPFVIRARVQTARPAFLFPQNGLTGGLADRTALRALNYVSSGSADAGLQLHLLRHAR